MSAFDHASFYRELHADHPNQNYFDFGSMKTFLDGIPGDLAVIELGGYDGELAALCLDKYPRISKWDNYDLDPKGESKRGRYTAFQLEKQLWEEADILDADVFVASHTIEHLSEPDVRKLLSCASSVPYLFLDAPLEERMQQTWDGCTCAHKLHLTWPELEEMVCGFGYSVQRLSNTARGFRGLP
jgi:hypothetical protein